MRLKDGFVLEEIAGVYFAVATGERARECHTLVRLNGTAAFLWRKLAEGECDEAELTVALLSAYDVDEATAKADVAAFIGILEKGGFLDE